MAQGWSLQAAQSLRDTLGWVALSGVSVAPPPGRESRGMWNPSRQPCRDDSSSDFRVQKEVEGAGENEGAASVKALGAPCPLSEPHVERSRLGKLLGNALL